MIKDLKLTFGIMKYAPKTKTYIVLGIVFPIIGILYEIMNVFKDYGLMMGGYFVALTPIYLVQVIYAIALSQLVQSSSKKKRLMTVCVSLVYSLFTLLGYIIIAVIRIAGGYYNGWENIESLSSGLVITVLVMFFMTLYVHIVYRWMIAGYLTLIPLIVLLVSSINGDSPKGILLLLRSIPFCANFPLTLGICFCLVILNGFIFYGLSLALYNKPLSERVFKRMLTNG